MNPPTFRAAALLLAAAASVAASVTATRAGAQTAAPAGTEDAAWPVAGQQGLVRFVIVPTAQASDRDAYLRQIQRLCEPDRSCFLNFYTNSTGAALAVPLPDTIDREATAVFRRSTKQGSEGLRWSCRLQLTEPTCF